MMLNPVLRREARVLARGWRGPVALILYVGLLALLGGIFLYAQGPAIASFGTRVGLMYWALLATTQLYLTFLIIPALTAAGVSGERERHTLDLVLVSGLSRWRFLWGKLAAALAAQAWLLAAALPVYSLLLWFGGISVSVVLAHLGVQLALAALLGAGALLCSALWRRTLAATVAAYGIGLLLLVGPGVVGNLIPYPDPGVLDPVHVWIRHANPFAATADAARIPNGALGAWLRGDLRNEGLARLNESGSPLPPSSPVLGVLRPYVAADPGVRLPSRSAWPVDPLGALAARTPAWAGFMLFATVLTALAVAGGAAALRRAG